MQKNKGTDSESNNTNVNADAKKQLSDINDNAVLPFFKCIISKDIDILQDESSDVLESE